MNKIKRRALFVVGVFVVIMAVTTMFIKITTDAKKEIEAVRNELSITKTELVNTQNELTTTREELGATYDMLDVVTAERDEATTKLESLGQKDRKYNGWDMCWRTVTLSQEDIDFFAKLLYCEAGSMGYDGQFWVASAILNLSERTGMSIWEMGHKVNMFAVAPWVDKAKPTQQQYDVINDALNYGWIANVSYFRTDYPHSFGKFMTKVENVYFNCP